MTVKLFQKRGNVEYNTDVDLQSCDQGCKRSVHQRWCSRHNIRKMQKERKSHSDWCRYEFTMERSDGLWVMSAACTSTENIWQVQSHPVPTETSQCPSIAALRLQLYAVWLSVSFPMWDYDRLARVLRCILALATIAELLCNGCTWRKWCCNRLLD